ncbi:hypothetical protein [Mucilaginibacter sp. OK098]|uniref:hypothetical protein n=1 Tax=Mucilaginibacter sp. OK098 TaxID=1855297 RepID=UPI0009132659|nr:hypothetical protein [Mucilaginibacter sp. OK098]SHN17143.1 hypothetical protein SAMN05216524_10682 [Mucilaginibacter sp. OK098]
MNRTDFIENEKIRVLKLYTSQKHIEGFQSKYKFMEWFINQLNKQDFKCYYCETSIFDIRELMEKEKLKKRKIGHGFRGPILEIDKMNNDLGYRPSNCVLACYYCNNDKSYTLDSEKYKEFFGPTRKLFFDFLIKS